MSIPTEYDYLAPDKSEIRELVRVSAGNLCHCTLPADTFSDAITHASVDEIWFCLSGIGKIWRKSLEDETIDDFIGGTSLTIPAGTHFQFRNIGQEALCFITITMPPWPGQQEAESVPGYWNHVD